MLVLRRKVDDKIVFLIRGEEIVIELSVLDVRRRDVKLGIVAPIEVQILRNELLDGDNTNDNTRQSIK